MSTSQDASLGSVNVAATPVAGSGLPEAPPLALALGFVSALASASSATDLCRLIVHSDIAGPSTIGCELVWVDHQAELKPVARYGVTHHIDDTSMWGGSLVAQALRERRVIISAITPPPPDRSQSNEHGGS